MTSRPVVLGDSTHQGASSRDEIAILMRILEEFRKLDPDLPIQYALSFLTLASNEGLSLGELATRLGIAQSSASRNVAALSEWHSFGKPGLDLVEAKEDPRERRRKLVTLTPKGHALVETLREILSPSAPARASSGAAAE
jgi:DNA-binding MarR family transcriptional regulator